MGVVEYNVRDGLTAGNPRGPQGQDGASPRQLVGHGHKVVLAANTTHHTAIRQPVRHGRTVEGVHHGGIDKPAMNPLSSLEFLITEAVVIQVVDKVNAGHTDLVALVV